jgi:hypothetical protein
MRPRDLSRNASTTNRAPGARIAAAASTVNQRGCVARANTVRSGEVKILWIATAGRLAFAVARGAGAVLYQGTRTAQRGGAVRAQPATRTSAPYGCRRIELGVVVYCVAMNKLSAALRHAELVDVSATPRGRWPRRIRGGDASGTAERDSNSARSGDPPWPCSIRCDPP